MSLQKIIFRAAMVAAFLVVTVGLLMAGDPPSYTVTRSFSDDQSLCDDTDAGSTTVSLTGAGSGGAGDMLTVVETLTPTEGGGDLLDLTIVPGQGGLLESVRVTGPGVFDDARLLEHPGQEAVGTNNEVVHVGGETYISTAQTGRDIWAPGDTMVYAFNKFDGNFDVSIRIDDYDYTRPDSEGCWGKYGIMARRTLDTTSQFAQISDHTNPEGTMVGADSHCFQAPPATGSCANFFGRNNHLEGGSIFESGPVLDPDPCFAPYLRLVREGNTLRGYVSDDSEVEEFPTDDVLWTQAGSDYAMGLDAGSSWFVGFANHTHYIGDDGWVQTIEFTNVKWDPNDTSVGTSRRITWDVPRSTVTSGLSYTIDNAGDSITAEHVGVVGENSIAGPNVSHTESVQTQQVGDFISRTIGETGTGVSTYDMPSDTYTMTGGGNDIGDGGDNMNFLYTQVTGDFVATAQILSRDLQGTDSGRYGLMARQSCHADARHEFIASDRSDAATRQTERLDHIVPDPDTNRENYVVSRGVVPGSPEQDAPAVAGNPSPATNPDHLMLIRTGTQVTSYVAWDDPANPGQPFHWCLVGSTNHQDRSDDMFVGMAINSGTPDPVASIDFKMDIQPRSVDPESLFSTLAPTFTLDFEAEASNRVPEGARVNDRSVSSDPNPVIPLVQNGRLRMTKDEKSDTSTVAYWADAALENILDTGFVAEFDVTASSEGTPGEGGTFVVIASGSNILDVSDIAPPDETPVGDFQNSLLIEHEGRESRGTNNQVEHAGGDAYISTAQTGRDVWGPGDTMVYAYNIFEGNFDVVVHIEDYEYTRPNSEGCWGKYGIMARRTLDTTSQFAQISNHTGEDGGLAGAASHCFQAPPATGSCPNFFYRQNHLSTQGPPNMGESPPVLDLDPSGSCFHPYLRLVREGRALRGYVSRDPDVEDTPTDDNLWTKAGGDYDMGLTPGSCWFVGFANHTHEIGDAGWLQTVEFRLIKWDGTPVGDCPSLPPPDAHVPDSVGIFEDHLLIEHPGRSARGPNNDVILNPAIGPDSYTSIAETGRDIWGPGDTMVYAYNRFEGNFDVSIRIDDHDYTNPVSEGCWGKYGIMARRTLQSTSQFAQIADHTSLEGTMVGAASHCFQPPPETGSCANFMGRRNHLDGGSIFQSDPFFPLCWAPYLRLVREGDTIRGYASDDSDVEDFPTDDLLWTQLGSDYDMGEDPGACWLVGFANHDHDVDGTQVQTIDFTLLKWDGFSECELTGSEDPVVPVTEGITRIFGDAGPGLGFGGEISADKANRLRQFNECLPMFAVEIDTSGVQPLDRFQFAGVNNEGTGAYHIGLNTNASTASRQINEQLGVAPENLPNLFRPENPVYLKVEYKPNGQIRTWVSTVRELGAGESPTLVLDTHIPPLTLGSGLGDPFVGFTAATGGSLTQTLDFDNLTITPLTNDSTARGACCTGSSCDIQTQADCEAGGGTYLGDGVSCRADPCATRGGCCTLGSCSDATQADCVAFGGTYLGDGVDCDVTGNCLPVGACCTLGNCDILPPADCEAGGGTYQGDGNDCGAVTCPEAGVCCTAGNCDIQTQADCEAVFGIYVGEGITCADLTCPTSGACLTAGNCDIQTPADCAAGGGTYQGDGVLCPELGGCCTAGNCDIQSQADCEAGGGTYQGDGSACDDDTCGVAFKRGDGDVSGTLNINDPIFNLIFQFLGGVTPRCRDALDTDDSGTITINDPIISLTFQFLGGVIIPLPGANVCGPDPTDDNTECADYPPDKC